MNSVVTHNGSTHTVDDDTVQSALNAALTQQADNREVAKILNREASVYTSTFPLEILTCKFTSGEEGKIVSKRQPKDLSVYGSGHRGGLAYEAAVYRKVLQHVQGPTPHFVGLHVDGDTRQVWLFLEYLEKSEHVNKVDIPNGLLSAAHWLGKFHAESEQRVSSKDLSFLTRYDAEFYKGWITRTLELTASLHQRFPWLPRVCNEFAKSIDILLSEPLTVIHSEFYPRNILVSNGKIYPVDWESVAIAAGEIDLACLTEGWGPDLERECESAYQHARWPDHAPDAFRVRAKMARAYQEFRWLGDQYQSKERGPWRIERVGQLAKELGILS